jgi:hypothetical protein
MYIKIPVQQIPFSQRDDISNAFPNGTQNGLKVHNAWTCASHINHTTINTVPSRSPKVQANSSCPKSTISYTTQETSQWHDVTAKTTHLRTIYYVETLNYSAQIVSTVRQAADLPFWNQCGSGPQGTEFPWWQLTEIPWHRLSTLPPHNPPPIAMVTPKMQTLKFLQTN